MGAETQAPMFDVADYLDTPEELVAYLNAALEDGDERVLLAAMMDVIKARGGVAKIAKETGLSREAIYKALSRDGNPRLSSMVAVLHALELDLAIVPRRPGASEPRARRVGE